MSNKEIISGVYAIKHKRTNKVYIGSSKNIYKRYKEHLKDLINNNHHSYKLQRSFNKNGTDSFDLEVLEIVEDLKTLFKREQYWIDKTKCYESRYGYNIMKQAGTAPHEVTKTKKYKDSEKLKQQIKSIEIIKQEYETSKINSELLETNVTIKEKSMSSSVYIRLKELYTVLPIYERILVERVIPFFQNKLKDKLILNVELKYYTKNHGVRFYIKGYLKENNSKYIIQSTSYGELKNLMYKLNIPLEDAIFKIITEETKCGIPYIIKE